QPAQTRLPSRRRPAHVVVSRLRKVCSSDPVGPPDPAKGSIVVTCFKLQLFLGAGGSKQEQGMCCCSCCYLCGCKRRISLKLHRVATRRKPYGLTRQNLTL